MIGKCIFILWSSAQQPRFTDHGWIGSTIHDPYLNPNPDHNHGLLNR